MTLELPAWMMSIVHSSIDLRIKQQNKAIEEAPEDIREYMRNDDMPRLLNQIRAALESQAETQGTKFERIHTTKE